jgi:hypothetical protein
MLQQFMGWFLSSMLILVSISGQGIQATKPTLAYTAPFRIEKVDYPADVYTGTHIALADNEDLGRTYVSYYDFTHHDLRLAFNPWPNTHGVCNGITANWNCLVLDGDGLNGNSADDVGMYSSINVAKVSFILVGVSYYDATLQALKFARYDCLFTCQETIETVDDPGPGLMAGSQGTSFKFTSAGVPYIAYSYINPVTPALDAIKLAHRVGNGLGNCGDGAAIGMWQCDTVDHGVGVGRYPSITLTESGGLTIQLAYLGVGNGLKYAVNYGENCFGGGAPYWSCSMIDQPAGGEISIHSNQEKVSIAYYDPVGGNLRLASLIGPITDANCGLISGKNTWRCDTIDTIGTGQSPASLNLTFDQLGNPAIAYQQVHPIGSSLRLARPILAYNIDPGNCGPVPSGGFEPTWYCRTVADGNSNVDEAKFTALAIRSNGLAIIAFTEDDGYNLDSRLMVAMQHIYTFLPNIKK